MDLELSGKRVLVTGASRGIGRAIAEAFAAEGAHVAICARTRHGVDEAVASMNAAGSRAWGEAVDVRDADGFSEWYGRAVDRLGGLDIIVSNVSTRITADGDELWRETFEADLLHHVRLIDMAMPHLRRSDAASVVVLASIASVLTQLPPGEKAYGTMKAALVSLCGQLANVHGGEGIRFNAVSPGPIDFPGGFWDGVRRKNEALYAAAARLSALGRLGTPEEVAKAVVFLASPAAGYITGANLRIDGGTVKAANF